MYAGDLNKVMQKELTMGHEAIGIVEERGIEFSLCKPTYFLKEGELGKPFLELELLSILTR